MNIKTKFVETKNKAKKHVPEITLATIAIASTAYAIILKIHTEERKTHLLAINRCCWDEMEAGQGQIWEDGCTIDLVYDPNC